MYCGPLRRVQRQVQHPKVLQRIRAVHFHTGGGSQREENGPGEVETDVEGEYRHDQRTPLCVQGVTTLTPIYFFPFPPGFTMDVL